MQLEALSAKKETLISGKRAQASPLSQAELIVTEMSQPSTTVSASEPLSQVPLLDSAGSTPDSLILPSGTSLPVSEAVAWLAQAVKAGRLGARSKLTRTQLIQEIPQPYRPGEQAYSSFSRQLGIELKRDTELGRLLIPCKRANVTYTILLPEAAGPQPSSQ